MVLFKNICLVAAATAGVTGLSLDGSPLRELLVDHGNGTSFFWTEKEHPSLELLSHQLVPHDFSPDVGPDFSSDISSDISERGPSAYIKKHFCEGFKALYPDNVVDDAQKFCSDVGTAAKLYFGALLDIFEHEVCETAEGASFACGVVLDIVVQSAHGTVGPEAQSFCLKAFDAIHKDCGHSFGGVDVSVTEPNGNERGVEYRTNAVDDDISSCKYFRTPTPGRPYQCKVHPG